MSTKKINYWLDAHVHLYACYSLTRLFDCAHQNLSSQSTQLNGESDVYVLFLVNAEHENARQKLNAYTANQSSPWQFEWHDNAVLVSRDEKRLWCVLGQQLVTQEGLEVLSVGESQYAYSPRYSIADLLEQSSQSLVLLPWGVGKWLGNRGKLIHELSHKNSYNDNKKLNQFFSDIPSRSKGLRALLGGHALLSGANDKQRLINGTDPLPIAGEECSVGSFGSRICVDQQSDLGPTDPNIINSLLASLKQNKDSSIKQFGKHQNIISTVIKQLKIRLQSPVKRKVV